MTLKSAVKSSIGKKAVMAITGLLLIGFIVGHLAGNLLIFAGPDALNSYAKKLRDLGNLLWVIRFILLTIVGLHIWSAICLTLENREARPVAYQKKAHNTTSYAARTMMVSGFIVLAYIIYHLLHFTVRITHPDFSHLTDAMGRHDVYSMVVLSFQQWPVSIAYIISMLLLSAHLSHGVSSLFQSLGLNDERWIPRFKLAGRLFAAVIFIGYSSIPLCAWLGILKTGAAA